jgi:hypothetical protein
MKRSIATRMGIWGTLFAILLVIGILELYRGRIFWAVWDFSFSILNIFNVIMTYKRRNR